MYQNQILDKHRGIKANQDMTPHSVRVYRSRHGANLSLCNPLMSVRSSVESVPYPLSLEPGTCGVQIYYAICSPTAASPLAKDLKIGFYTFPTWNRTPVRRVAVHYTIAAKASSVKLISVQFSVSKCKLLNEESVHKLF